VSLLTPTPNGIKLKGKWCKFVEHDVYDVVKRMRELDPNLHVVLHEGDPKPWCVMESCADGETRFVKRYDELTPAILDDLRRMLHVPFQARIDALQKDADEANDVAKQKRESAAWEEFVWDFRTTLRECGFTPGANYTSRRVTGDRRKRGGV
jgi:hypothetical protein